MCKSYLNYILPNVLPRSQKTIIDPTGRDTNGLIHRQTIDFYVKVYFK